MRQSAGDDRPRRIRWPWLTLTLPPVLAGLAGIWTIDSATAGRLEGSARTGLAPVQGRLARNETPVTRAAMARWEDGAQRGTSPTAAAKLTGVWLSAGRIDEAVRQLERAVGAAGGKPSALVENQLAVAYLERATRTNQPIDLLRALGAADRAAATGPQMAEPRYNRAMILERLYLHRLARKAWKDVVAHEPEPRWRDEAQKHVTLLAAPPPSKGWSGARDELERAAGTGQTTVVMRLVRQWPEPARRYGEEELLARWAEEAAGGHEESAQSTLTTLRMIAKALASRGDFMLNDSVAVIERSVAGRESSRIALLIEGHRAFARGLKNYRRRSLDAAEVDLEAAEKALRAAGSPFVDWARLFLACCDYYRQKLDATAEALTIIERSLPGVRYSTLVARLHWVFGSVDYLRGRPGEALPHLRLAGAMYSASGELDSHAAIHHHLAMTLGDLGDFDEAWREHLAGLRLVPRLQGLGRATAVLEEVGASAIELGEPEAALDVREELLMMSYELGESDGTAASLLRRGQSLASLGRLREAERDFTAAAEYAAKVSEPIMRERLEVEIDLGRAELELATAPRVAADRASRAVDFLAASDFRYELPLAHLLRARARLAAGDEVGAVEDYFASLDALEDKRNSVTERQLRVSFFDHANTLFDEVLDIVAKPASDVGLAFAIVERGRGRDLFERLYPHQNGAPMASSRLLGIDDIRRRLPHNTALVRYALLPHHLLVWCLRSDGTALARVSVESAEIDALVNAARAGLQSMRAGKDIPQLQALYRLLVAPLAATLRAGESIVFVPDKALHLLPFAALVDPATNRYLVEEHAISVAPSANVYVQSLARQHALARRLPTTALIVGASTFDAGRFPALGALPGAEVEAQSVAALYPSARLLTGPQATRSAVLAGVAANPDVIHLAAHSLINPVRPNRSMILLAPEPPGAGDGIVYAQDAYEWSLPGTSLVVLAACDTAAGELSASEGTMSFARPFLAAGVPAVVGSLWRVDDVASRELLTRFHRRMRAGDDAQTALRTSQLSRLHGGGVDSVPGSWAAFEVIGGAAPQTKGEGQ